MQSSTVPTSEVVGPSGLGRAPSTSIERRLFGVLGLGAVAVATLTAGIPGVPSPSLRAAMGEGVVLVATFTAAGVLAAMSRRPGSWSGTRFASAGLAAAVVFQAGGWLARYAGYGPRPGGLFAGTMTVILVTFLAALAVDFFEHVREGRAELLSDVLLVSTLAGAAVFVLMHAESLGSASVWGFVLTGLIASCAILIVVGWSVLALWCPSPIHISLLTAATGLGSSALFLDSTRRFGSMPGDQFGPEVLAAFSVLAITGVLVIEPRLNAGDPRPPRAVYWIRPSLSVISLLGACGVILVTLASHELRLSTAQSIVVTAVVFTSVGLRTLLNQIATVRSARELEGALTERESAIASLRSAADVVTSSESRLRLLLNAAVDGVVELDAGGTIVRANGAFCSMVHLPMEDVVGRHWEEMAKRSGRGTDSLAALPETGEAVVATESGTSYLEARSSTIPTTPPGRLLMIRDVTPSKTAEQTIRTLFQFLQDRDEDRTRLLKRTNSAIEAERNRIARDLHDGPIQGVSATTLSLEALRMMMESGETRRALHLLRKVSDELSEEAMNLRRIMSDLRPPVLEQRGLIPAVRELCDRWHDELGIEVEVIASAHTEMPSDVETLAYRVVQEALSNVKKHAEATHVTVRLEATSGTLRVEVRDDGVGFDPEAAREFLRSGRVGLASMRERAELAGGTLTIKSGKSEGTTIMATLPFDVLAAPAVS